MNNTRKTQTKAFAEKHPEVDKHLSRWGFYTYLESGGTLDFLSQSELKTLSQFGIKLSNKYHKLQWPAEIEKVDALIGQLKQEKPKWATAVMRHYSEPGTIREQASRAGLERSTYHNRLIRGRDWLREKLA